MYPILAAWLTMPSKQTVEKSENMISTIGFIPSSAAPIPHPSIVFSMIGVSMIWLGPNSSIRPVETPKMPS